MTAHTCTRHPAGTMTCYKMCRCRCDPCTTAYRSYSKRILHHPRRVDATGTRRRIQALAANGWPLTWLSARLGLSSDVMGARLGRTYVTPETAEQVRRLYDDLWDVAPPASTRDEKGATSRARTFARRHGWVPPLAWDDDAGPHGIDNPHATPVLGSEPRTMGPRPSVRVEDVEWLASCGATADGIAHQLGVKRATLLGKLRDAGRDDLLERLERKVA